MSDWLGWGAYNDLFEISYFHYHQGTGHWVWRFECCEHALLLDGLELSFSCAK